MSATAPSWTPSFAVDDEEEETILTDEQETQYTSKDSILFVIDFSKSMLEPLDNEKDTPFQSAMKCVAHVLKNKIISSDNDEIGIVLYGTREKRNGMNFEHIYVLQELQVPDAQQIKDVDNIVNGHWNFEEEVGSTEKEYPLGDVFWTCSNLFGHLAQKVGSKRVFLITNEDNPHATNPSLRNAAKTRAKDLAELGIRIELFNLDKKDEPFNVDTFYRQILDLEDEYDDEDQAGPIGGAGSRKFDELMVRIRRREVKKRSQYRLPFHVAPGLTIGVRGYSIVLRQEKGKYTHVYMKGERVRETYAMTSWMCADTTQFLMPTDIKYYFPYGGEKVVFTKEEMAEMRNFGDPGITLLGFKARRLLKNYENITHAYFIYPDEKEYLGSTRVFSALLQRMASKDKIAICHMIRRSNTLPRFVALLPQEEVLDANGGQERPPGFHVITLPYADDIRSIPIENTPEADVDLVDAAKIVIEKLIIKGGYRPEAYENPSLQRHFASLQAIALAQDIEEDLPDKTLPKYETIHKRIGPVVSKFENALNSGVSVPMEEEEEIANRTAKTKRKREPEGGQSSSASKRRKAKDEDDLHDVPDYFKAGKIQKCTVAQLKTWLSDLGIDTSGNKADLIERVTYHLSK
ncbi:hypothetical protein BZG36_04811 [Bifiguratus adelaidae]|uniref:ATP-dependent DNA helicase II subunit 1 n=1 Tax=Bifiguratus adelaidae TaxID=1938954 RepID=A0A261XTZ1_9FUNG|nr:hypothetical protein BZG36_04811 [Bifiguratus adelaidae]